MRALIVAALLITTGCRNDPDSDEDGVPAWADCNDVDAAVGPGQVEVCNGVDDNCDGTIDNAAEDAIMFYADGDGDGAGYIGSGVLSCSELPGYVEDATDCNDSDAAVYPGASEEDCADPKDYNCDGSVGYANADGDAFPACQDCDDAVGSINPDATEVCDGADNDCDGEADEAGAEGGTLWYLDKDTDTFGDAAVSAIACDQPTGYVANNTDCDDLSATVNPAATEVCNDADDDCDGMLDEEASDFTTWYADNDGDGVGGSRFSVDACDAPDGYGTSSDDCDDLDPTSYPSATELCDGADNDCDGTLPTDEADGDSDGFKECDDDCDDSDGSVHPGAAEYCNGVDNDCNGAADDNAVDEMPFYPDADGDGHGFSYGALMFCEESPGWAALSNDCDDDDAAINPSEPEQPGNGIDDDCDGITVPYSVFGVDRYTGELWAVNYDSGEVIWTAAGLGEMIDVIVAPDGTLYASVISTGSLLHLDSDGSNPQTVATGYPDIHGLWYDHGTDTVLLTTYDTIAEYDPSDGSTSVLATGLATEAIHTVRLEGDDTLYTTFRVEQELRSYAPSTGTWTVEGTFSDTPQIMIPDKTGGFWVAGGSDESLMHIGRNGATRTDFNVGTEIHGICDSPVGDAALIYGDFSGSLVRIDPVNGGSWDVSNDVGDVWGCDTNAVLDIDGDGFNQSARGGGDCDDTDASVNPGAIDTYGDAFDHNCDGVDGNDADGDGYSVDNTDPDCVDPDDGDSTVVPTTCVRENCAETYAAGATASGIYTIDPTLGDLSDSYDVYCNMEDFGGGWERCLEFVNTSAEDETSGDWFDNCVDTSMAGHTGSEVMVKLIDDSGVTLYNAFGSRPSTWTYNQMTSTAATGSQYHSSNHSRLVTLNNTDKIMLPGKNSSNSGYGGSFGNGYLVGIYPSSPNYYSNLRMIVAPYRHTGSSTSVRQFRQWDTSSEISFVSPTATFSTQNESPPQFGTFEFYVR